MRSRSSAFCRPQIYHGAAAWKVARVSARDQFDPTAPGGAFDAQAIPLDNVETNYALHFRFEHRLSPILAVFGRVAHSLRTPNVDERIGVNAFRQFQSEDPDFTRYRGWPPRACRQI